MGTSPFYTLSAELRNRIYEEVFRATTFDITDSQTEPALTRVCRQFRSESLMLCYTETRFVFKAVPSTCNMLPAWLKLLTEQKRRAIKRLEIEVLDANSSDTWRYDFNFGDMPLRTMAQEVGGSGVNLSAVDIRSVQTTRTTRATSMCEEDVQEQVTSLHCRLTGEEDPSMWW